MEIAAVLIGLAVGAAAGYWLGRARSKDAAAGEVARLAASLETTQGFLAERESELKEVRTALDIEKVASAESKTRLESAREHFAEQRRQIEEMEKKVRETFEALSAAALKSNNEQFVKLAEQNMKPLREQLERYEQQMRELEKTRQHAYGGLNKHLESLEQRSDLLGRETKQLVAALRQSGAKGKWGEITLQRIVELAGMTEHCDFSTQATLDNQLRPDLLVRLPGGRSLVVDAKVNTGAYLDALDATDDRMRKQLMEKFIAEVRSTMRTLAGKEYWRQLSPAPEFVVMFIPGEAFFAEAVSRDKDLIVDGVDKKVILASPTTLIALLMAVRHGWQQQQVAENAEKIAQAGRDLHERLCQFVSYLDAVRGGIVKAADAFDKAVGNLERRTLPSARKLEEFGASSGKTLPDLQPLDLKMRQPASQDDEAADESRQAG